MKENIVDAATHLFAERGYAATSIKDISLAVGLSASAGGIYRHFKSKREILSATFERHLQKSFQKLQNFPKVEFSENLTRYESIRHFVLFALKEMDDLKDHLRVFYTEYSLLEDEEIDKGKMMRAMTIQAFIFRYKQLYPHQDNIDDLAFSTANIVLDLLTFRAISQVKLFEQNEDDFASTLALMIEGTIYPET